MGTASALKALENSPLRSYCSVPMRIGPLIENFHGQLQGRSLTSERNREYGIQIRADGMAPPTWSSSS